MQRYSWLLRFSMTVATADLLMFTLEKVLVSVQWIAGGYKNQTDYADQADAGSGIQWQEFKRDTGNQ